MIILTYCTLRLFYVNNFTSCLFAVRHRVDFKLAILVYKALHGLAPLYCTFPTTVCWRRKSVDFCDQLMHEHVSYHGPGPSLVTGALLWLDRGSWRTLAAPLRDTDSIYSFKKQLKTYLV